MLNARLVLLSLAVVCFLLAAVAVPFPRVNLVAAGLMFWVLSVLIGA
jgi:hypothetical protein